MSKCGINRYKAGGRCGTFETSVKGNDMGGAQLGTSFSAMLAAREAQDVSFKAPVKQYATPALTHAVTSQAVVLKQEQVLSQNLSKKQKDIDMILQGDFD
jgi:hypothetical protein